MGSATTIVEAFIRGRAAIDHENTVMRDEQIVIIKNEMERICAGTAIHYLNGAISNITDPTKLNHELSEAYAFTNGLRYGDNSITGIGISATDIDAALALIGTDFSLVTTAKLNSAIDIIAAGTGLTSYKSEL